VPADSQSLITAQGEAVHLLAEKESAQKTNHRKIVAPGCG
jgi:hypothetical protein